MSLEVMFEKRKTMSSSNKCIHCNGSGELVDKRTFRAIICDYCDGCGYKNSYNEYKKETKKKRSHRKPKFGRDFDINFEE